MICWIQRRIVSFFIYRILFWLLRTTLCAVSTTGLPRSSVIFRFYYDADALNLPELPFLLVRFLIVCHSASLLLGLDLNRENGVKLRVSVAIVLIIGLLFVFSLIFQSHEVTGAVPVAEQPSPSSLTPETHDVATSAIPPISRQPLSEELIEPEPETLSDSPTLQRCVDAELSEQQFLRQKERVMMQFLKQLTIDSSNEDKIRRVLLISGIDVANTHLGSPVMPTLTIDEMTTQQLNGFAPEPVHMKDGKKIMDWVLSRDYTSIINAANRGEINPYGSYAFYDLLTLIVSSDPQINEVTLTQLLNVGVQPTVSALVVMTKQGRPETLLQLVKDFNLGLDFSQGWGAYESEQNLFVLALENKRLALASFWYEQGIEPFLVERKVSALDVFPKPSGKNELSLLIQLVRRFAAERRYPFNVATLEQIKSWLPFDIQEETADYFEQGFEQLNELRSTEEYLSLNQQLSALAATHNRLHQNDNCHKNQLFTQYKQQREKQWRINERKSRGLPLWLLKKVNRIDVSSLNTNPETQKSMRELLTDDRFLPELKQRMNDGETLPADAVIILISNNRLQMLRELLSFGLDVHARDSEGNTAWHYAVVSSNAYQFMDFLQEYQVDIHQGRDLVIHMLERLGESSDVIERLNYLENAGATINSNQYAYIHHRLFGYSNNFLPITNWYEQRLSK